MRVFHLDKVLPQLTRKGSQKETKKSETCCSEDMNALAHHRKRSLRLPLSEQGLAKWPLALPKGEGAARYTATKESPT